MDRTMGITLMMATATVVSLAFRFPFAQRLIGEFALIDFPAKRESSVAPPYGRAGSIARDFYENESNVGRDGRERAASASYYSQQRRMPWMEPFDGDDQYYDAAAIGPGGNSSSMREISVGSKSRIGSPNITR